MKTLLPGLLTACLAASLLLGTLPLAAPQSRPAQALPPSNYKLIAVKVVGSKRFTQEDVVTASGLPVGTIAHEEDFKKAARQLGESGAFGDISFSYTYSGAGTKLEFHVADAEKFVPARFNDFVWFTDEELLHRIHERVPLFKGDLPTTGRLAEQVSDILQAMLVETAVPGHVEFLRITDKKDQLEAIGYGVSGVTIRVRQVEFPGAGGNELPLFQEAAEKLTDRVYSRILMNDFIERVLLPTYHQHGYLKAACAPPHPKVVKAANRQEDESRTPPTYVDVTFPITSGIQYKLTRWEWSGNKEIPTDTLQPLLHMKVGQTANTVQLEADMRAVQELYGSHGYVTGSIKADAEFDDAAGTVAYQLEVKEGFLYHMGELQFRGIDNNLTARLRAAWKLRPGDVYDVTYLKQFLPQAKKLLPANLDWDVIPHVTPLFRDKTVDVDLQYTAKAPQ